MVGVVGGVLLLRNGSNTTTTITTTTTTTITMQEMNIYLDRNGIDLEKDFEAYIGSKRSDIMPRPMFKKARACK